MKKVILVLISIVFTLSVFAQRVGKYRELALANGGVTHTLPLASYNDYFMFTGTVAIGAPNIVQTSGSPIKGMVLEFWNYATVTYSGSTLQILGTTLTELQASSRGLIRAIYSGSAWKLYFFPSFLTTGVIDSVYLNDNNYGNGIANINGFSVDMDTSTGIGFSGTTPSKKVYVKYDDSSLTAYNSGTPIMKKLRVKLQTTTGLAKTNNGLYINYDDTTLTAYSSKLRVKALGIDSTRIKAKHVTLSKMEDLTRGYIYRGNASNRPIGYNAKTLNSVLIGDGNDIISSSVTFTGDVTGTLAPTTALTIGADKVTPAKATASLRTETVVTTLCFDSACYGDSYIYTPWDGEVRYALISINKRVYDDILVEIYDANNDMFIQETITPTGSLIERKIVCTILLNEIKSGGSIRINIKPAGATTEINGSAILTLVIEKD